MGGDRRWEGGRAGRFEVGRGQKNHTTGRGCVRVWGFLRGATERGSPDKKEEVICFGSYNVMNGCNVGLELALSGMYEDNIDPGIF